MSAEGRESRRAKKRLIRLVLGCVLVAVAVALVTSAAGLMSSLTASNEELAVFTPAAELPPDLINSVGWAPDADGLPRSIEPLTRADITVSWLRAWEQMTIVSQTGDVSGVETYFSNSALEGVLAGAESWGDISVHQLGHELEVTFYSEDGQILGLRANETKLQHREIREGHTLVRQTTESYEAVLVLEDGNWRIHHWVRQSFEPGEWAAVNPDALPK